MTSPGAGQRHEPATPTVDEADDQQQEEAQPTLLEQMGGISGLIYSSVPVLVFVAVNAFAGLGAAIWTSIGCALLITAVRLVRREPVMPAISGLFGVAIAAFIAYRTGSAKGFFLFGIWANLIYGGVFAVSVLVRWPLAGVIWSTLNGTSMAWRADKRARFYYDAATLVWTLVFAGRFVVQHWLYEANLTGWLVVAKFGMGYPLMAIALAVTVWSVRKADLRQKDLADAEPPQRSDAEVEADLRAKYRTAD